MKVANVTYAQRHKYWVWLRTAVGNLFLIGLVLLVCGIVVEVGLRAYLGKDLKIFPRFVSAASYGDFRIRTNRPNTAYQHSSSDGVWRFQVNSVGFRGKREFGYEKPSDVFRILVLGDSHTFGYEAQQDQTYAHILGQYLQAAGQPVQILNAGVAGFGTAEALVFLREEGVKYRPDAVILGFASNDYLDNVRSDLYRVKDGALVLNRYEYVPGARVLGLVNSVPLFRWLSQHSYAYVYSMNSAWLTVKNAHRNAALRQLDQESAVGFVADATARQEELASLLIREIKREAEKIEAQFLLVDIPHFSGRDLKTGYTRPLRSLPSTVDGSDPTYADDVVETARLAEPWYEVVRLFLPHGDRHISPYTHFLIAQALGERLVPNAIVAQTATVGSRSDPPG